MGTRDAIRGHIGEFGRILLVFWSTWEGIDNVRYLQRCELASRDPNPRPSSPVAIDSAPQLRRVTQTHSLVSPVATDSAPQLRRWARNPVMRASMSSPCSWQLSVLLRFRRDCGLSQPDTRHVLVGLRQAKPLLCGPSAGPRSHHVRPSLGMLKTESTSSAAQRVLTR